jgi:hypothetical protein
MQKINYFICLILIVFFVSCRSNKNDLFWVLLFKSKHDTTYFYQKVDTAHDIENLYYIYTNNDTEHYSFNLKYNTYASYSGIKYLHGKNFINIKGNFIYLSDTVLKTPNGNYTVCKYLMKIKNSYDEDSYYYWCPSIGILLIKSTAWPIDITLHAKDKELDNKITYIVDAIKQW